jgi:F0F1-type ATP synthase membrane subunit b/b'
LRAAESLERAAASTAEYEAALRAARSEVYQTQEQLHQRLQEEQAAQVHAAREQAEAAVRDAKAQLAAEIAQAKTALAAESDALASQIADVILNRGVAA